MMSPSALACAMVFVVAAVQLVAVVAASGSVRAAEKLCAVWLQLRSTAGAAKKLRADWRLQLCSAAGLAAGLWNQTRLRCQCQ